LFQLFSLSQILRQNSASPAPVACEYASVSAVLGAPSALEELCHNAMQYKLTLTLAL